MTEQYNRKKEDQVVEERYSNGQRKSFRAMLHDFPANGWSYSEWYEDGQVKRKENYSHGQLIEIKAFDTDGQLILHKIWNNRLRQLIDKPAVIKYQKPNVVTGYGFLYDLLQQLPAISNFIEADFNKSSLLKSYDDFCNSAEQEAVWRMTGKQMSFTIYWKT